MSSTTQPKKKAAVAKPKTSSPKSSHPATADMVINAVSTLKERNGSSLQAIKKSIADSYKVDTGNKSQANFIRKAITKLVETGKLIQTKGTGANGRFKIPTKDKAAGGGEEKKKKVVVAPTSSSEPIKQKKSPKAAKVKIPKVKKAKSPAKPKATKKIAPSKKA